MFFKQFGGKVNQQLAERYAKSENWSNGSFQNLQPISLTPSLGSMPRIIYKQFANRAGRNPDQPLEVASFSKEEFLTPSTHSKFIWYGHSALFLHLEGKNILVDPMLGPDTTPISPFPTKRFSENTIDLIDDFPQIDLILLTHDHYDHLDFASIQKLKLKTKQYFVALGVKRHLVSWGVDPELITEFDWWESQGLGDVRITFTPTQHFSGRGLRDRMKTLWGGWVFKTPTENIWFSGDGGYSDHFREIGRRLGPFDFAFMECGQYNHDWHPVHLFPAEAVQAALDAGAKKAMPVHWAGFDLSYQHTWSEPAEHFVQAAREKGLAYTLPLLGTINHTTSEQTDKWWA